jgi:hypothetical protein
VTAIATLFAVACILTIAASVEAAPLILLQDDFNDNSIDGSTWNVVLSAPGSPGVTETGQRIQLVGRGHLNTAQNVDPNSPTVGGLRITGTWQFGNDDFLQILTRSDGTPAGSFGETANGIEMFAYTGNNTLQWQNRGGGSVVGRTSVLMPGGITPGQTFDFELIDDGFNLQATLTQVGNPANTGTITGTSSFAPATNLIVFHNRENGRVSFLDDVVVASLTLQAVPEHSTCALSIMGLLGLLATVRPWRRRA